jgi:hypothetical protein
MIELVKRVFGRRKYDELETIRKYQTVYNTPEGRWVLEDILGLCKYGESALGSCDGETNFNLGMQNVGIELVQRMTANIKELQDLQNKEELSTDVYDEG